MLDDKIYGVKIRHKESGKITENWFSKVEIRDQWVNMYSADKYELLEYVSDQQEFAFDSRQKK